MRSLSPLLVAGSAIGLLAPAATAQIESDGTPAALWAGLAPSLVPIEFVQPPEVGPLMAEDEARGHVPLRYGALLPVQISPDTHGVWDLLEDGTLVWRLRLYSPGAKSLGLEFSDFELSEGSQIYLYDEALDTVHGAFTAINNQPHDQIQFSPLRGDALILEYVQPAGSARSRLELGTVIYDYRDLFALEAGLDAFEGTGGEGAGVCMPDVNCPEGAPFPLLKRSALRTIDGGALCSGALVNNSSNDQTRYVITAWHCGQGSNTIFRFNYQTSGCGSGSAPTNQNVSGATLLASNQQADGRLLRINNNIPASYNPYYAGWSRSTSNSTQAVSMNHPGGGPKKIAIDNNGATQTTVNIGGIGNVLAWRCVWNVGSSAGGSSGGPLYNQDGRLVGQLSGGPAGSCPNETFFGRFHNFWNNTNISTFLDPTASGAITIPGFDPNDPGGGGNTNPDITSISPPSILAVNGASPISVVLTGTGFDGITDITVDGVSISTFPPQFTVVNDTTISITLAPPINIGSKSIVVIEGAQSDSVILPVTFNLTPTIDLINSDPSFLVTLAPLEIYMGGLPNDLHFLLVSGSPLPTVVPGIFSASIGNNFASLFLINNYIINPVTGWALASLPVSGLPIGTKLYFQSGSISAIFPALPLTMSNVESGTVLF
jgi:hypothetical protein